MRVEVYADPEVLAREAARCIARHARESVTARGRFLLALSGGSTPPQMLAALAQMGFPWAHTHVFQVDERVTPAAEQRNITQARRYLVEGGLLPDAQLYPMPVEDEDLGDAAERYATLLVSLAGSPSVLDLVHLGLGSDGHTASLVPGDPVLEVQDRAVGVTGVYQGCRRMTLTYPLVNRARCVLWLVSGTAKARALQALQDADKDVPAGRVERCRAVVFADRYAANTR